MSSIKILLKRKVGLIVVDINLIQNKRGENSTAKGDAAPRPATPTKPVRLNSAARTRIIKTNADSGKAPVASLTMKPQSAQSQMMLDAVQKHNPSAVQQVASLNATQSQATVMPIKIKRSDIKPVSGQVTSLNTSSSVTTAGTAASVGDQKKIVILKSDNIKFSK